MMLRRISGAEQPKAIRVRFATVGFQMLIFVLTRSPVYLSCLNTTLLADVITPIALERRLIRTKKEVTYSIKTSVMILKPRKMNKSVTQ